ncbi:hypothetical protein [Planctomycetes bacterium K23_9]|uniref:hypothetical protein n=1 Tax=Stieleria marina TaxID=1930275 RepID=UPI0011A16F51
MSDLLLYSGDDSPVVVSGKTPNELSFGVESLSNWLRTDDVLFEYREEPWKNLTSHQTQSARIAADDLVRRIESEDLVVKFSSNDNRVLLTGDWPIQAWPPGFCADKQTAIVRMTLPWGGWHHAVSTHILERDGDRWTVILRQFVYYP